jgi:DNA-binding response OmpR family regulator
MRILIVEDDPALGTFLQKGLQLQGHEVHLARDGVTGLESALALVPELMVLDLSLPQKDGVQVLEGMQGRFASTSVLVLTGRNELHERLRCLNLGADDCMLKPFSFSELTARCKVLIRRREQFADPSLRFGGVELNRIDRSVVRDGQPVELTQKEFALLEYLLQARGRCCTRGELLREVWQMSPDAGTNVVDVYVNYLRRKLGHARLTGLRLAGVDNMAEATSDRVIDTIRGEGYAMADTATRKPVARADPADAALPAALDTLRGSPRGFGLGVFGGTGTARA